MGSFGGNFRNAMNEVSRHLVGWDDLLIQVMFGLATREHVFWLSQPGRAKSWAARSIFSIFPDAKTFMIQLSKDMMPEALFGQTIPDEFLKYGKEIVNTEGGICEAELAFLDEFLDAPDFLVRSVNSILNERKFERKDQQMDVPLHLGIMTTNFDRYGTALEAVRDRMMCKAYVPSVGGLVDRMGLYGSYLDYAGSVPPLPTLSFQDLVEFANQVESPDGVKVSPGIMLMHGMLVQEYIRRRIEREKAKLRGNDPDKEIPDSSVKLDEVTPRTEAKLHDFSRAAALLCDRTVVEPNDLRALRYGLITMGSGNGDEATWEEVCGDIISSSKRTVGRLNDLAAIAQKVGELKRLGRDFKDVAIAIAGQTDTYTRTTLLELVDSIMRSEGKGVQMAAREIKGDIALIGQKPVCSRFPRTGDWK